MRVLFLSLGDLEAQLERLLGSGDWPRSQCLDPGGLSAGSSALMEIAAGGGKAAAV